MDTIKWSSNDNLIVEKIHCKDKNGALGGVFELFSFNDQGSFREVEINFQTLRLKE